MKAEIMTLCEYASENNGKLTIVDAFDFIVAAKFPWRAYFSVASRIELTGCDIDCSKVYMKIFPKNNPSKIVFEADSQFNKPKELGKLNMVAGFKGLIFDAPGDYLFTISLDDTIVAECPFKVISNDHE